MTSPDETRGGTKPNFGNGLDDDGLPDGTIDRNFELSG
jgi:hypothetical protein